MQMKTSVLLHGQVSQCTINFQKTTLLPVQLNILLLTFTYNNTKAKEVFFSLGMSSFKIVNWTVLPSLIIFWYGLLFWYLAIKDLQEAWEKMFGNVSFVSREWKEGGSRFLPWPHYLFPMWFLKPPVIIEFELEGISENTSFFR